MSGSRRRPGRLVRYVDGYRVRLLELGYSPLSVASSLAALGHLGRWMDREGLAVDQLDRGAVEAFLAAHAREHGHLPTAGVMPLLDYLRGEGFVDPEPVALDAPLDRLLAEYREWLLVDRALAPDTVRGYVRLARRFLAERTSANDQVLLLGSLMGAEMTGFLLGETARVRPGRLLATPTSCARCCGS